MKKEYIIPIFVPHLGCPNSCTFCNQKTISGQAKQVTAKEVKETIEYYLSNFKDDNKYVEVAFFGGSFTGIEEEVQEELLQAAFDFIKQKKVNSIRISTRPDYIDKKILKRLKKYKVKTIELGVQSTNDYILARCQRGHTFEDVKKASKLIRRKHFILGHQMMVGLPESTKLDEINTTKSLIKLKPKIVRIYPVLVIKGTKLEEEYRNNEYIPLTVNQAVERCKEIVTLFNKKNIRVIRIGLQNTNTIDEPGHNESEVVAGPYHPAFRQLVESSMWYDSVVEEIKQFNTKVKLVQVRANPVNINNIIGHKKENIEKLNQIYDVEVKVVADEKIKPGHFKVEILKTYDECINVN
ncbi:MAG: radical SAM protein [Clostridia bacterium]|nr:radical SAM domain protein [Clostridium sp. CAG:571]HJJ06789.1 radical SAM protein [Clostridiaceae bacterium]HJJ13702.1 radical SAM protein [Clostridiaceae bacterium]